PFPPLLREIVRQAAELRAARKPLACVLATADPAAVIERASLRARAIPVWTLGPLEPEARAEMAADFFAVETVPPALTGLLAEKSSTPAGDLRLLRAAAGAGARVDFLGELSLPPASLQKLASEADAPLADVRPAPPLDRQLDLLRFAEGWLTAPEMRALFGEFSSADWRRGLETLHSQGLVRRRGDGSDTRYSAETSGAPASGSSSVRKAGSRGAREPGDAGLRTPLLRAFEREGRRGLLASPDAWAVWGRHLAADGRPVEALRRLLRAARALERADRPDDARRLLEEIVRGEGDRQAPRFLLARLRLADVGRRLGRGRAALRDLGPIRKSHPLWFQRAARFRKGLLLAQIGEPESAVRQIERLLRLPVPRPATPASRWFFLEAEARLARLYLDAGRAGAGRRALDALLPRLEKAPAGAAVDRATRALGILASCELTHGDRDAAARHLETARALARAAGRPDLEMEPLNELAVLMAGSHRLDEALSLFEKLEELARRLSDPIGQIRALYNQGITCYRLQRLEDAEERHRRARRLSDALGPHAYSATVWIGLAVVLRERGRLTEALRLYRKVLRHLALARTADEAVARNNLGEVYLALGRLSRSLDERRRALDLARSTENRFLLGLALRSLGSSLWALGRAAESRAALEECLAVESASADPRHLGSSLLFLGCQAAMEGDAPRAVKLLRRARTECRRAGDRAFAEAASLALLEALARRREPGPSRRRLARFLPQPGGAASVVWPVIERALRARLDLDRPTAREELLEALRDGAARGLVWQTFLATTAALGDPALPPGIAAELEDHRELLASVMTRRLDPDGVAVFRACWLRGMHPGRTLAPEAASSASTPQDAAGPPISAQQVALPEGSLLAGLDEFSAPGLDAGLMGLLDRLRRATGSRRAWTIRLGEQKASFWTDRGTAARPLRLLREGGGVIERARRSGEIEEAGGGLLLATARSSSLLLFLERPPGGWSPAAEASARLRIAEAARLVHLLFRLQEAETALEGERAAHRETRDSLRQLTAALGRDKELIDTALISRRSELAEEVRRLGQTRFLREGPVREPVARSRPMRELMSRLPRLAEGHLPILILGESGVGKDLLARWIHSISPRRKAPFLAEICSLPESLLESELFGFVRGAFTDAVRDQPGLFQRVNKGTLYLDEIADLSPALQSRLLRVIESRRVRPLGSDEELQLDFRLISSSRCADPDELVARGLRRDLFYRLQGQTITVPPLRERPEEIPHLARELAARFAARANQPVPLISPEVLEKLTKHSWPGNVRELANEIERALLENPRELLPSLVLKEPRAAGRLAILPDIERGLRVARDNFERQIVAEALRRFHGNASAAARWLRVTRRHLGKLIEKHVLDLQAFKR
ncbi:MAG: sigma 54-interacting transcriptional regulator, partial [Planctomycetes bacterium]|nr:sigma 54-interacting transcriptional regulator [Planctomycetota bacterium]